jgi:hypothetical protein
MVAGQLLVADIKHINTANLRQGSQEVILGYSIAKVHWQEPNATQVEN